MKGVLVVGFAFASRGLSGSSPCFAHGVSSNHNVVPEMHQNALSMLQACYCHIQVLLCINGACLQCRCCVTSECSLYLHDVGFVGRAASGMMPFFSWLSSLALRSLALVPWPLVFGHKASMITHNDALAQRPCLLQAIVEVGASC